MLEISIDLKSIAFKGDLLDIGFNNYGVIYNLYKNKNTSINVEYISEDKENSIENDFYDNCALFLCLSGIRLKRKRKILIDKIYKALKGNGELHIWDIDKGYLKTFYKQVNIILPNSKSKEVSIKDINILKDTSMESTINIINKYFNIIDTETFEGIYYIKAQKKRREKNNDIKSIASGD